MLTQRYAVTQLPIEALFTSIKSGDIAISEIQIANYVVTQSEINIAIGNKEPKLYFGQLLEQCQGGPKRYGNITDLDELRENFRMNCIPDGMEQMTVEDYPAFLVERRKLVAQKIKVYFRSL